MTRGAGALATAIGWALAACALGACAGAVDPQYLPDGFGQPVAPDRGGADRARNDGAGPRDGAFDRAPIADLVVTDAPQVDAAPPPPRCAPAVDSATLALYRFEDGSDSAADDTGQHPGTIVGAGASRVASMPACGNALGFQPTSPPSYLRIDDAPAWDLDRGALDLWVRFDADATGTEGILSRDASGTTNPGHVSLYRVCTGAIVLRLQEVGVDHFLCSAAVGGGAWHHLGVSFGPAGVALFVDGQAATHAQPISCPGIQEVACGGAAAVGIAGNDNPWVLGALSWNSGEGGAEPVVHPLAGRVDALRLSNAPRSFAPPL